MNVLTAYDNLPHDLIVEKREAYGFDRRSLHLVSAYLNFRKQRIKIGSAYTDWDDVFVEFREALYQVLYFLMFSLIICLLSLKSSTLVILQMVTFRFLMETTYL